MICANRHIKDAHSDGPIKRPQIDVGRELRYSPRSREEVDLALAAIKELYAFIDGHAWSEWNPTTAIDHCNKILRLSPSATIRGLAS